MNTAQFLQTVVTVPQGYFCLATRDLETRVWNEHFFDWPGGLDSIVETATDLRETNDVYYTSYLFNDRNSKKTSAILDNHLTIQSDLDDADPKLLQFEPSLLVQTSANRYQAYWTLSEQHYDIESLSRKLTYSILNADRSGWPIAHKMRLPGTFNYKYIGVVEGGKPQPVYIIPTHARLYDPSELDILPSIEKAVGKVDIAFVKSGVPDLTIGPNELLETVKAKLPLKVYNSYNVAAKDRSAALWALTCSLFRAGLSRDEVLYLAHHSANNKWPTLPRELAKDVLRAEVVSADVSHDAKEIIINARKMPGTTAEKHRYVLTAVKAMMEDMGSFINTTTKGAMFVQKTTGHPIELTRTSEGLQTCLGSVFGLNPTEREEQFIAAGLEIYARSITSITDSGALSHYDLKTNTMLLHTGRKDVLRITPDFVETIVNGNGVVFDWITDSDPFAPVLYDNSNSSSGLDWAAEMFTLHNTTNLSEAEHTAIMKSWFLFLLFRNMSSARPVLLLNGQPGSGKTTTAKRVYNLIYGQNKKISSLSTFEDFDNTVSNLPFVFYDNVDSYLTWLPDRIAQSAGAIDVGKRKLYTNNESFTIKRDAMIALTAHNPRFLRPDVVDRLILINLNRYGEDSWVSEEGLIHAVTRNRNLLWGAIVRDVQTILASKRITEATVPMRISDFTTMGEWFADALGYRGSFISGMKVLRRAQKSTDLEEDQLLAQALIEYSTKSSHADEYRVPGAIWLELTTRFASDPNSFIRTYKNASVLSKKLLVLQTSLKEILDIEWQTGPIRTWRIRVQAQDS